VLLENSLARSSSPKEPPLEALTEPDVKLSLHPALIIQLYIYQRANSLGFLLLKALTYLTACVIPFIFLYLRFAHLLSFFCAYAASTAMAVAFGVIRLVFLLFEFM